MGMEEGEGRGGIAFYILKFLCHPYLDHALDQVYGCMIVFLMYNVLNMVDMKREWPWRGRSLQSSRHCKH